MESNEAWRMERFRARLRPVLFGVMVLLLVWSWRSHALVHQLGSPVLAFPGNDPLYWLAHAMRVPEFLTGHAWAAWLFDASLFLACFGAIVSPRPLFPILFWLLYGTYFIVFNTYIVHHSHDKVTLLLLPIPFFARRIETFSLCWEGLRYYTCLLFSLAFVWKIARGALWIPGQGTLIVKRNLAPYLYFHPDSPIAGLYHALLRHPGLIDNLFRAGCLLEGIFLVGLFTRRFDRALLLLTILFPVGFLLMADANFFTLSLLAVSFLPSPGAKGK